MLVARGWVVLAGFVFLWWRFLALPLVFSFCFYGAVVSLPVPVLARPAGAARAGLWRCVFLGSRRGRCARGAGGLACVFFSGARRGGAAGALLRRRGRAFFFWCSLRGRRARLRRGGRAFFFLPGAARVLRVWLRCCGRAGRAFFFLARCACVAAAFAACGFCCWRAPVLGRRWGCAFAFSLGAVVAAARRSCAFLIVAAAARAGALRAPGPLPAAGAALLLPARRRVARCGRACRRGAAPPQGPSKLGCHRCSRAAPMARRCSPWRVSDYSWSGNSARRPGACAGGACCPAASGAVAVPGQRARRAGRPAVADAPVGCCGALGALLVSSFACGAAPTGRFFS